MKKPILFFAFVLLILSGCRKHDDGNNIQESCYSNTNAQVISHDGIERQFVLYVPNSYNGVHFVPLVLNFHGFGDDASNYMNIADMRRIAESDTFIVAYPQGSCSDGSSHWNPCPIGGDNKSTADDLGFIESLVDEISARHNVDRERVYAVGYSNGGMMAYGLANHQSDLVAAVASVSGAMLDCQGSISHPMPVVHLHGTSDAVLPYDGDSYYSSVQSTLDYWIDFNNTVTTPTLDMDDSGGSDIGHYIYGQGDSSVSVEHYKYVNGGHVWFSTTFQGKRTSELVWDFLSKYDINGLR